MKNINPLFLLLASFFILLISVFSFIQEKKNISNANNSYENYKITAYEYNNLKNNWHDIKKQKKYLEDLLISSKLNNANISNTNKIISVSIKNIDINKLNKFVNKLLNSKLNIKKLNITQNSLKFEVGNQ